jgi:hypothetical protein
MPSLPEGDPFHRNFKNALLKIALAVSISVRSGQRILLNHADQGIAQDYAFYCATLRELLHTYVNKYIVHQ